MDERNQESAQDEKPSADPRPWERVPVTPDEAIDVLIRLAYNMEIGQGALVLAGLRQSPHVQTMRDAHILNYTAQYIQREVVERRTAAAARKRSQPTGATRR